MPTFTKSGRATMGTGGALFAKTGLALMGVSQGTYTKTGVAVMGTVSAGGGGTLTKAGTATAARVAAGLKAVTYTETAAGGFDPEPPALDTGNPPQSDRNASGTQTKSGLVGKTGEAVSVFTGSGVKVFAIGGIVVPPIPVVAKTWRYIITNLDGVALGEPRASARTLSLNVSAPATASFRIRSDDPLWDDIADGETMLKVYDSGNILRFYGPCVADEESGSGQGSTVQVTASDLSWRLARRYVGKDTTGVGLKYVNQDAGVIAANVLARVNAENATGISLGTVGTFVSLTTTYLWKRALDVISELGALAGSFEWALRYVDGTPPGVFLDLSAQLGTNETADVFFEYGTGRNNCRAYTRVRSRDRMATHVWVLGSGSTLTAAASDAAAAAAHRSRYEDVLSYGDITVASLLDALAAAHVAIRAQPRRIYSVTPFLTGPAYGTDYVLGDLVTCRIVSQGSVRASGIVRVWGVDVSIDELGTVTSTPRLVPA